MKLIINYDLMNEIGISNTGFNLKRFAKKMVLYTGITIPITASTHAINPNSFPIVSLVSGYLYATFIFGGSELALRNVNQQLADSRLKNLASSLTKINIYTDVDSIKKARLYKTQYQIIRDDKPAIQQNKFMMIPTNGTFNADEISLQQEHIIGSKEYVLSMGEPKKKHSKVLSSAFARQI